MKKFLLAFVAAIGFAFFSASAESVIYTYAEQGFAEGKAVPTKGTYESVTVTYSGSPAYYAPELRLYQTNTITFSVPKGYAINEITFHVSSSAEYKFKAGTKADIGSFNVTDAKWTSNGETTQTVTITAGSGKQVRISSWTLTYTTTGGGETPTTPKGTVAKPSFNPAEGEVAKGTNVKITTATEGATIYYTTDGVTEPTATSTQYTESGITIDNDMTIKAIAIKEGMTSSEVATASYTIAKEAVAMPTFSVTPGTVDKGTTVEITTTTEGAKIYYTIGGIEPTTSSTLYTGAITIDKTMTIKAFAVKDGMTDSKVATASYTVFDPYTDVITVEDLNVAGSTDTGYSEFTVTGESGAEYFLQCAHNGGTRLQFRSKNSDSGLVVTKSAGRVKSVTLKWIEHTQSTQNNGKIVNIYTSTTPYTNPTELYNGGSSDKPTLKYDEATNLTSEYTFKDNLPKYIGLRSKSSALYLDEIKIAWEPIIGPEITYENNIVTITAKEGATIYYTLDGSDPTTSATREKYTGPFPISATTTVTAVAYEGETQIGSVASTEVKYVLPMPVITCEKNLVTITAEEGATIYYTTGDSEASTANPDKNSTLYEGPFPITKDTYVKAITVKGTDVSSTTQFYAKFAQTYANYAELVAKGNGTTGTVDGPIIGIYKNGDRLFTVDKAGNYMLLRDDNKFATITDFANGDQFASVKGTYAVTTRNVPEVAVETLGAKTAGTAVQPEVITLDKITSNDLINKYVKIDNVSIAKASTTNNYTLTDGNGNTLNLFNQFTSDVTVPTGTGFTVVGFISYYTALQVLPTQITEYIPVAAPVITCENNTVTITAEEGATIYYTTDGREPDKTSTLYEGPFPITANTTVKAIAVKGTDVSSTTQFYAKFAQTYADYAAIIAAGDGSLGTVNGPITGIYKNDKYLYTVDANGKNMLLVDENAFADVTDFANGDQFASVTGTYTANTSQIAVDALGAKTAGTTAVEPEATAIKDLVNAKKVDVANKYVKLDNVTIVADEEANCYDITDATASIRLYNRFLGELAEGSYTSVIGFVDNNYDVLRIIPIQATGLTAMEQVATPEFSVTEGSVDVSTAVQITFPEGSTVYYTIDGTKPLVGNKNTKMYTGEGITINKSTTINAIAVAEGKLHSKVATATYIVLADEGQTKISTFDFTKPAELNPTVTAPGAQKDVDISNMTFTSSDGVSKITFSGQEDHPNMKPRIYENNSNNIDLRIYNSHFFTISVTAKQYILDKIVFTHTGNNLSNLNCGGIGLYTENGTTATWIKPNDQTDRTIDNITFTATDGVCISTITVYYKEGVATGVDNIEVEDVDAPTEYYNLQGVRVDNPGPGLYIVRRGNTVTKTLIR